jgi:hypothetical protein
MYLIDVGMPATGKSCVMQARLWARERQSMAGHSTISIPLSQCNQSGDIIGSNKKHWSCGLHATCSVFISKQRVYLRISGKFPGYARSISGSGSISLWTAIVLFQPQESNRSTFPSNDKICNVMGSVTEIRFVLKKRRHLQDSHRPPIGAKRQ